MINDRHGQAGVTLIEMLAALAVSALIGVAGFTLLESVLQTEAGVAGKLDRLVQQDRAFQLLAIDLQTASHFDVVAEGGIALAYPLHMIVWRGAKDGLVRRIVRADRVDVTQTPLASTAELAIDRSNTPILRLSLPDTDVWRIFPLPPEGTP